MGVKKAKIVALMPKGRRNEMGVGQQRLTLALRVKNVSPVFVTRWVKMGGFGRTRDDGLFSAKPYWGVD
jgi:hypothetical protein